MTGNSSEESEMKVVFPKRCDSTSAQGLSCQREDGHTGMHKGVRATGVFYEDEHDGPGWCPCGFPVGDGDCCAGCGARRMKCKK